MKKMYIVRAIQKTTGLYKDVGIVEAESCGEAVRVLGGQPEWRDLSETSARMVRSQIADTLRGIGFDLVVFPEQDLGHPLIRSEEQLRKNVAVCLWKFLDTR